MNKALLVGINAYQRFPQLFGCINDVQDVAAYLKTSCGFADGDIRTLTDGAATAQAIRDGLRWLLAEAATGDRLLFHYSGHGTTFCASDGTVVDAICPIDFDWTPPHAISATDFAQIFSIIPDGVVFNWISDSCHSGDLTEDASQSQTPSRMVQPSAEAEAQVQAQLAGDRPRVLRLHSAAPLNGGFLAGCGSAETAADAEIGGRRNGAFTRFLLNTLQKSPDTSLVNVVADVVAALRGNGYSQTPCVHGADRIISESFLFAPGRTAKEIMRPVEYHQAASQQAEQSR